MYKDYFRITFCSDLMCSRGIKDYGVEFIAFNVLLHTKSEQKVIGNRFCAPIIFENPLKTGFSRRNIVCIGRVSIVIRYFLLGK